MMDNFEKIYQHAIFSLQIQGRLTRDVLSYDLVLNKLFKDVARKKQ